MIYDLPKEYREKVTYEQAEETMLRHGRMFSRLPDDKKQSLIYCMMDFRDHYDRSAARYCDDEDEFDDFLERWKYEINAFNIVYLHFEPLFAPKTK